MGSSSINNDALYRCRQVALSVGVLCWLLLLGGCAANPFANLEEWKEIQSKNFIVYTNAKEKVALEIVQELEAFRAVTLEITTIPPFEEKQPIRVYLFKNRNSFTPFQSTENTLGYFVPGKNFIVIYAYTPSQITVEPQFPIVYHEYIHYLISKHPANFPRWYDEGLATIFETFEFNRGHVTFGKAQLHRWNFMKYLAEWIPMDEFLSGQTSFAHNKGFTHAHSQAWALMHYFFYGSEDNLDKVGEYIYLVNNGHDYDAALRSVFELTPEELLQEVKDYVAQKTLRYSTLELDNIAIDYHHRTRSLKEDEARKVIQDLHDLVEAYRDP